MKKLISETHKILALIAALLILASALPITVLAADETAATEKIVAFACPAIPADTNEPVVLADYSVMFSSSAVTPKESVTWSSSDLTVTNGTVKPSARGVYVLTATFGTKSKTVYLVVKEPNETEYVLYEEDFDAVPSFSNLGYTVVQQTNDACTVTVDSGKLVLSAQSASDNYIRVLLPDYLHDFGNYKLEAVAAMTAYQSTSRWMSFMFRIRNKNYPYYQMAVRANATADNGTELAYRTPSNNWDVQYTAPFTQAITDKAYHTYTIEAYDSIVHTMIDDYTEVAANNIDLQTVGGIGLQVRACEMSLDKIRVTLQLSAPDVLLPYMAYVETPTSNVVLPATVATSVDSASALEAIAAATESDDTAPATAIFRVNASLNVLASDGSTICTVSEAIEKLNETVIPAFRPENEAAVKALCAFLEENRIADVFILSDNADLVRLARDTYTLCRGILDFSGKDKLTKDDLAQIRDSTNACGARICLLPGNYADREVTESLQRLFMTVWIVPSNTSDGALLSAITAGANGIVTENYARLMECYTEYFEKSTLVRTVGIVAHRGVPSLAQENTIAGSMRAYELGATAIENDIQLTKDGVIVVMHDSTIDRTTNGTGKVSDYTYAELQKYSVDSYTGSAAEPIPTLADYFEAFKGLDVQLIIEIKTNNTAICAPLVALIREYDILDQVNVITFHTECITKLKELCPEISVGYLTSTLTDNESNPTFSVQTILETVQSYDTTYNPTYGSGALGPNLLAAASHRGITVWPWTLNDRSVMNTYFLYGTYGITTNYTQYISSCVKYISTDQRTYKLTSETLSAEVILSGTTYNRTAKEMKNGSLIFIEGDDIFTYENGILKASCEGAATLMLSHACLSPNGEIYYLCSEPFTVVAAYETEESTEEITTEGNSSSTASPSDESESGNSSSETSDNSTPSEGCESTLTSSAVFVAVTLTAAVFPLIRKKRSTENKAANNAEA